MNWNATSKRLHRHGYIPSGAEGHHWLIPRNGWGGAVPDSVKNAHWNILPVPKKVHTRLHSRGAAADETMLPRFNLPERLVHGTPLPAKAAAASATGHSAVGVKEAVEKRRD